jgi:hypothetical protein
MKVWRTLYAKIFGWFWLTLIAGALLVLLVTAFSGTQPLGRRWMRVTQDLYAHTGNCSTIMVRMFLEAPFCLTFSACYRKASNIIGQHSAWAGFGRQRPRLNMADTSLPS